MPCRNAGMPCSAVHDGRSHATVIPVSCDSDVSSRVTEPGSRQLKRRPQEFA